jgi:C1A family cysteine protease
MKISLKSIAAALLVMSTGSSSFAGQPLTGTPREQIAQVQAAIAKSGAKWVAGENSLTNLSDEEWQARVGYNFKPLNVPVLDESNLTGSRPAQLDWRDNQGNYVSPVTDQKKCGSCWAFAMTAGLESYVMRTQTNGQPVDLAEQVMLSCSGAGTCKGGQLNASYLKSTGLPPEADYPYTATDGSCGTAASGWQGRAQKIGDWNMVWKNLELIKMALAQYGPIPTAYFVFEDFKNYKSGVYSYTTGKKLGGHAVLLVGYNDAEKYFIVKNSWGPGWGENGYFRIAYDQMDNEVNFALQSISYNTASAKRRQDYVDKTLADWGRALPVVK